jgi:hypothetical protein
LAEFGGPATLGSGDVPGPCRACAQPRGLFRHAHGYAFQGLGDLVFGDGYRGGHLGEALAQSRSVISQAA